MGSFVSRRSLFKYGGLSGLVLATNKLYLGGNAFSLPGNSINSRFFIQLYAKDGLNTAYFFDARPLALTKASKIQNYLGEEPFLWASRGPDLTLATRIVKPLLPLKDYFSIVNGVFMSTQTDGHEENINYSLTASTTGGNIYFEREKSAHILDAICFGSMFNLTNIKSTRGLLSLSSSLSAVSIAQAMSSNNAQLSENNTILSQVKSQASRLASNPGELAHGARNMLLGANQIPQFVKRFTKALQGTKEEDTFENRLNIVLNAFRYGLADNAILVLNDSDDLDFHDESRAKTQSEEAYGRIVKKFAYLIETLRATPFDPNNQQSPSFLNLTTFALTSEFNRTMRQPMKKIDETGTDHNTLGNSIWIGGAGIKGGMVVGSTDLKEFDTANDRFKDLSNAHAEMDSSLLSVMGKPFDFKIQKTKQGYLPKAYHANDYIQYGCVANTLLASLSQSEKAYWRVTPEETAPTLPILSTLLTQS